MPANRARRAAVLAALRAAGTQGISGEALAETLGVSRVAVGKHVNALRALGYSIEATRGSGYQLLGVPDLPLPDEVAPLLRADRWRLHGGVETGSTNDDVKTFARADKPEGEVVLSARQVSGRGRLGRAWCSPEGGLYLSLLLRPPLAPVEVAPLALAIGVGVARGLETLGAHPLIKWPNDLLHPLPDGGRGKLVGILLEMSAEADAVEWVVAGCGINVRRPSEEAAPGAAYLSDVLPQAPRLAEVAAVVLDGIAEAYDAFVANRFAALAEDYRERDALLGQGVTVRDATGRVLASGKVEGVDDDGRLVLHNESGRIEVAAGEVTLRA